MKKLLVLIAFYALSGCIPLGYQQFYELTAPTKYPNTTKVMVFEYSNVNIREIYDLLYSDFLVIGKSGFNGPYQDPKRAAEFAKSIGADVFIAASQFKETRTSFVSSSTPTTSTTYISGYTGSGSFYGTATSYGTKTTTEPISVDRYNQHGLYLRNLNNVQPLWERKRSDYKETEVSELSGVWYNENYELKIIKSGKQMVAFISSMPKEMGVWQLDDIKMIFSTESGVGFYLMGDKTPQPVEVKLNKFGHLEVKLITQDESLSFAKK